MSRTPILATKEDQSVIRQLKRKEKSGEYIDWDREIGLLNDKGKDNWKRYMR